MADEGKKVSFGFSKSIKKSALKVLPQQERKKVDYIECLDEKSIKVVGAEEKKEEDEPVVIPLLGSKTWHDRILNKTDADIFEPKVKSKENGVASSSGVNGNADSGGIDLSLIKKEITDDSESAARSLDERAASEIINDLRSGEIKTEDADLELPVRENESLRGEAEPTAQNYEEIPVDAFGLAMLRGMGWKPGRGIGKNDKPVAPSLPELRPKGMGLGADKVALRKDASRSKTKEEEEEQRQLRLEKGAFVKIIAGKHSDNYGVIEGLDDDAGRLIVKLALGGDSLSLSEFVVTPVTKAEYGKNSKVLNATKYKEYEEKRKAEGGTIPRASESESSTVARGGRKSVKKSKRSSDSESERRRRRRRRRSNSSSSSSSSSSNSSNSSDSRDKPRKRRLDDDRDYKSNKSAKKSKREEERRESSADRSGRRVATKRKKRKKKKKKKNEKREKKTSERGEYSESLDRRKRRERKDSAEKR